ncbi:MAG: M48 family metalloprotease, partial [Acidobacteria bacterium]|nr:M48 family metalloprotease [Acidobacteriota bacterium]
MTPLTEALTWTLLHSLWQGAILAVLLRLFRTYGAALAAMAMLCVASVATFASLYWPSTVAAPVRFAEAQASGSVVMLWIAPLWAAGATLTLGWNVLSWWRARNLRRRFVCAVPVEWTARLEQLARRLNVTRPVELLESALADAPVVLGHFKPAILLPAGLVAGLPASHIEAILLHELSHIRRNDYLMNLLQRVFESMYFYHPAAWWMSNVARQEREHCCDDAAIRAMAGDRRTYAIALAQLEQFRTGGGEGIAANIAVAANGGNLMSRIRRILGTSTPARAGSPVMALALAAFLLTGGAVCVKAWQTAHDRWLNEDVVYIVNQAERDAFEKMTNDEERGKFIEQFWARRGGEVRK